MTEPSPAFWDGRRVLVTGHTGFKGSWLCLLLAQLGARVDGFALDVPTVPALYTQADVAGVIGDDQRADIRDLSAITEALRRTQPEVVFHLAAQPLVRESYARPAETFSTNVLGTVIFLEAVRSASSVRSVVIVTTDKVYENREWLWAYRESDRLGGLDPYSASKACAEIAAAAYERSFLRAGGIACVTARAGNVIGGGDWSADRLLPDCVRAFARGESVTVRNPGSVRPWQHVLDCLHGYMLLAETAFRTPQMAERAFNFGPSQDEFVAVDIVVRRAAQLWGEQAAYHVHAGAEQPHESGLLRLDTSLARMTLGWAPLWDFETALQATIEWYRRWAAEDDTAAVTRSQVRAFLECVRVRRAT